MTEELWYRGICILYDSSNTQCTNSCIPLPCNYSWLLKKVDSIMHNYFLAVHHIVVPIRTGFVHSLHFGRAGKYFAYCSYNSSCYISEHGVHLLAKGSFELLVLSIYHSILDQSSPTICSLISFVVFCRIILFNTHSHFCWTLIDVYNTISPAYIWYG